MGKNDGSVQGVRYFTANPGSGIFLRPEVLKVRTLTLHAVLCCCCADGCFGCFVQLYDEAEWAATTIGAVWRGHHSHSASLGGGETGIGAGASDDPTTGDEDEPTGSASGAAPPKSILKSGAAAPANTNSTTSTTTTTTTSTFVSSSRRNPVNSTPPQQQQRFVPVSPQPTAPAPHHPAGYRSPAGVTIPATAPIGVTTPRGPHQQQTPPLHPYASIATKSEREVLASERQSPALTGAAGGNTSQASSTSSSPVPPDSKTHIIWVWGDNEKGELSIQPVNNLTGPKKNAVLPTQMRVPSNAPIAQLSLGLHHTVALNTANDVFTCGEWVLNCLGHGDAVRHDLSTLRRVKRLGGGNGAGDSAAGSGGADTESDGMIDPEKRIVQVSCGDTHCVALYASGELYTWGGTLYGKLGLTGSELKNKKVVRVDCGNWHTAVCTDKGSVYTFGGGGKNSNFGQLGHGEAADSKSARRFKECPNPTLVQYFVSQKIFIKDLCCGGFHTLALTDAGDVYAWGKGEFGQLGLGTDSNSSTVCVMSNSFHMRL